MRAPRSSRYSDAKQRFTRRLAEVTLNVDALLQFEDIAPSPQSIASVARSLWYLYRRARRYEEFFRKLFEDDPESPMRPSTLLDGRPYNPPTFFSVFAERFPTRPLPITLGAVRAWLEKKIESRLQENAGFLGEKQAAREKCEHWCSLDVDGAELNILQALQAMSAELPHVPESLLMAEVGAVSSYQPAETQESGRNLFEKALGFLVDDRLVERGVQRRIRITAAGARRVREAKAGAALPAAIHHRDDEEVGGVEIGAGPRRVEILAAAPPTAPTDDAKTSASPPLAVVLGGPNDFPLVRGKKKPSLSAATRDVIGALLDGPAEGLTGPELDKASRHTDSRKILGRLAKRENDWASVIVMAGKPGHRYRIER